MKVALCAGWYLPESVGGTESYVHSLALELRALGVDSVVLAPLDGEQERRYVHEGVEVVRYPVPVARGDEQHSGRLPHGRFERFAALLEATRADVFHLHSLTYGCNVHHLAFARELGLRTVTTVHVPGVVCARGTLMLFGAQACDGRMLPGRCAACWAQARGLPRVIGEALEPLWTGIGPGLAGTRRGSLQTLLRAPARIANARARLLEVVELSGAVVAVCDWLRDALVVNGVPADKITTCRQGVRLPAPGSEHGPRMPSIAGPLRVGFFGRANPVKGLDTLVRAVRRLPPRCAIVLGVHALANLPEDHAELARAVALAAGDPRIRFLPAVPASEVASAMRDYDLIAVPSRWLETGPIVAMQALAAGVPVLGSDLGGLSELIAPGETGWLLPHDDVAAWTALLVRLSAPGAASLRFEPGAPPLISEREVAQRMCALYAAPP